MTRLGSCADIGYRVSVNKSVIPGVNQDSAEIIKNQGLQSCNDFAEFPLRKNATSLSRRTCRIWFGARACTALMSLGRGAEWCASWGICWFRDGRFA